MKLFYDVDGDGPFEFESDYDPEDNDDFSESCAEQAAEDYENEHDGWESNWPIEISLRKSEEGPVLKTFTVEKEYYPFFSASEKKGTP